MPGFWKHLIPHPLPKAFRISVNMCGTFYYWALLAILIVTTTTHVHAPSVHSSWTPRLGVTIDRGARVDLHTPEGEGEDTVGTPSSLWWWRLSFQMLVMNIFKRTIGQNKLAKLRRHASRVREAPFNKSPPLFGQCPHRGGTLLKGASLTRLEQLLSFASLLDIVQRGKGQTNYLVYFDKKNPVSRSRE